MSCPVRNNLFNGSVLILSFSVLPYDMVSYLCRWAINLCGAVLRWGFFKMPSETCFDETPQQVLTHALTNERLTAMNWTQRHISFFIFYVHECHRGQRLGRRNCWLLATKFCWPIPTCTAAFFIIFCQFSLYVYHQSFTMLCIGSSPSVKSEQGKWPTSAMFFRSLVSVSNVIYPCVWLDAHGWGDGDQHAPEWPAYAFVQV